jgi:hypothetical protein
MCKLTAGLHVAVVVALCYNIVYTAVHEHGLNDVTSLHKLMQFKQYE